MKRTFLDTAMLILFFLTMSYQYIPEEYHEIIGICMGAAIIIHLIVNYRFFTALLKTKRNFGKNITLLVDVLLIIMALIIVTAGIAGSKYLFHSIFGSLFEVSTMKALHRTHKSLAYLLLILTGLHLGTHWAYLRRRLINWQHGGAVFLQSAISKVILGIFILLGICSSFWHRAGARLCFTKIPGKEEFHPLWGLFALTLLSIVVMYAAIGYFAVRKRK